MKGFVAGVVFTLVTEGVIAAAVVIKEIMEGADNE